MRSAFLFLALLLAHSAQAATFCVGGAGYPPQCLYDDIALCRQAASPPSTSCIINPEVTLSYIGGGRYCTVGSERVAQCLYVDRALCNSEATRRGVVCFDRDAVSDDINPFRYDSRIQN